MWRLWVVLGALVWVITIVASGAMNFFFGQGLGRTPNEGLIFALVGVGGDTWKAIGPIFLLALWRERRVLVAALGGLIWVACFTYAVSSAIGLAAQNRSTLTSSRDALHTTYQDTLREIAKIDARLSAMGIERSARQIEAEIRAVLAKPVSRRATVGSLSKNCGENNARTHADCALIARLKTDLAGARDAENLEARRTDLRAKAERVRDDGGASEPDPQAQLIARLTSHRIETADAGLVLVLVLAVMIELISAFAPVVLSEYASTARAKITVATRRDTARPTATALDDAHRVTELLPIGGVYEFMAGCVRPKKAGRVAIVDLIAAYNAWCARASLVPLEQSAFVVEFARICRDDLDGRVEQEGTHYVGLALSHLLLCQRRQTPGVCRCNEVSAAITTRTLGQRYREWSEVQRHAHSRTSSSRTYGVRSD